MIKNKLRTITLVSFVAVLISCNSSTTSNTSNEKVDDNNNSSKVGEKLMPEIQHQFNLQVSSFLENLKSNEELSSFFSDSWLFVYHEDNRCDGSTDGQIDNLTKAAIDSLITVQVKNDGDGWACDKKESTTYYLDFDLKKMHIDWDRFEVANSENAEENIVYVFGKGESEYLKLYYNDDNLIVKLKYSSEDPG